MEQLNVQVQTSLLFIQTRITAAGPTLGPTLEWIVRLLWHPTHSVAVPSSQCRQLVYTFTWSPIVVLIIPSTRTHTQTHAYQ